MLGSVSQFMEKRGDPSGGEIRTAGVKMMGEAPEVLTAVIEIQSFGRLGEAIFDQVPYPEGAAGHGENFFCPRHAQIHRLGLYSSSKIDDIGIRRHGDHLFFQ